MPASSELPQQSRKSRLKAIARKSLLKEFELTTATNRTHRPSIQPTMPPRPKMGIKDSDDYITARAANPRTGLISPSLAGTPRTPESPAEALRIRAQRSRPALTRANEARKISAGKLQRWCANEKGWVFEDAKSGLASPRPSDASAGAADIVSFEPHAVNDSLRGDRFVVHMPSAREPQPYAFPGRSAQEIQAFEHYKSKARKTSNEGWDQRCVQSGGIRKASDHERGRKSVSASGMPGHYPTRDGTIVRRGLPSLEIVDGAAFPGAEGQYAGASFAPYSSPKTPARRTSGNARKSKAPRVLHDYAPTSTTPQTSPPITHLSQLPKLHLIRPELASLPMPKLRRSTAKHKQPAAARSCSLGCERSPDADTCPSLPGALKRPYALFASTEDSPSFPTEHATALVAYLLRAARAAHQHLGANVRIRIPQPAMIATLTSADASIGERIAASRALLALAGQVMAVLMAVTVVWKLLDAVAGVVGLLIWPLVVPVRLIWWVLGG